MFAAFSQKYLTPKNVFFGIVAILLLLFITKIPDIAVMFFASFVIACSMEPLVQKLSNKMSRATASALVILGSLLILGLLFVPLIIIGANEIKTFTIKIKFIASPTKYTS